MNTRKSGFWEPLRERPFRLLFASQLGSDLGTWLDYMTVATLVAYTWHMGPGAVAAAVTCYGLPWVLVGPFAGVWTERHPPAKVMLICHLARLFAVAGMIAAPSYAFLLPLVLLKATLGALFDPARQRAIRLYAPEALLARAVAMSQLSASATKVVGPALGGAMIAVYGPRFPFYAEGAVFLLAALVAWRLPAPAIKPDQPSAPADPTQKERPAGRFLREFREGVACVKSRKVLATAVALTGVSMFIVFLYDGLFSLISRSMGFDQSRYGILIGAVGLGAVAGNVLMGQWKGWTSAPLRIMCAMGLFSGTLLALIGMGGLRLVELPFAAWAAVVFAIGLFGASFAVPYGFILQSETPPELVGRVSALANAVQTFAMLAAPAIGALLAAGLTVGGVLILCGALTAALSLASSWYVRGLSGQSPASAHSPR